jgi:hypothetical protein
MRPLAFILPAGAALFGLLVAARALLGPLQFPVPIHTPINIESFCGLLVTAALLMRLQWPATRSPAPLGSPAPRDEAWLWGGLLAVLVAAGFWRAMGVYFLADDFVLVTRANSFQWASVPAILTTAEGNAFFRPLVHLSMAATAAWARFDPRLWHLNALALHAVNVVLVYALASRLGLARHAGLFAAALFAIHGALPESTVWIAGWFGVLSTFWVLCGLLCFLEYLSSAGRARLWYGAASLASMVLGMLSKETAYAFPLIAVLVVVSRRMPLRSCLPMLAAYFGAALTLFGYRWSLLGGIGGYTDLRSGGPLLLELGLVGVLRSLLLRLWAVLYFPVNWSAEPGWWLGALTAVYAAALVWLATHRGSRLALLFPAGFVILAALPAVEQMLIGPDLQKSRALYLPLVGFCLLLGTAVEPLGTLARRIVPAAILLFHFAALQHNLTIWQRAGAAAQRACLAVSRCSGPAPKVSVRNLPGSLEGVYFLGVGFPECIGMDTHAPPPEVEMRSSDPADLAWDPASAELRCQAHR